MDTQGNVAAITVAGVHVKNQKAWWKLRVACVKSHNAKLPVSQRAQYPLIKEYSSNHNMKPFVT